MPLGFEPDLKRARLLNAATFATAIINVNTVENYTVND